MLHGLQGMPTSTQDDMSGNPLQEGILADSGIKPRDRRDESFASVRRTHVSLFETPEFETTQIVAPPDLYRHGLESEATHRAHIQTPDGITDNLHAALGNLGAWVENPYENGQLRPYYNKYWKVIRPSFMKPGSLQIGVADPTMAEIINHVAQTNDLAPLYQYRGHETHQSGWMGDLAGAVGLGALNLIPGVGEAADAAAIGDAAATAGEAGAAAAGAAGAGEAAGAAGAGGAATAGGGVVNAVKDAYNSPLGKGLRYYNFGNDVQNLVDPSAGGAGAGAGAGGGGAGMPTEPTSFYSRRLAFLGELLKGLGGGGKAAEGLSETPASVSAPAVGGVMKKLLVPLSMSDDLLGMGAGAGLGGPDNGGGGGQDSAFYSRTASDEDDASPASHDEIPKNEDGDSKQKDDGNNHEWQRDLSVDGAGGSLHAPSFSPDGPAFQRFMMLLPLMLQAMKSGEDLSKDPLVHGLHQSLESEIPGYLDQADDEAGKHLMMILTPQESDSAAKPEAQEETHTDENSGGKHEAKSASLMDGDHIGGDFLPEIDVILPSLNGMARHANPALYQIAEKRQGLPPDIQAEIDQMLRFEGPQVVLQYLDAMTRSSQPQPDGQGSPLWDSLSPIAKTADTQGPQTPEQIKAVQEFLFTHGHELSLEGDELWQTILSVPTNPLDFADILAKVQKSEAPPTPPQGGDMSPAPPMPAQENAPPGATMPMPGMEQQMMSAVRRYAADSVAGVCPNCGGHTTELIDEDGTSRCHGCQCQFKTEDKTPNKLQIDASWNVDEDLRKQADGGELPSATDDPPVQGVPMADQTHQRDRREEQDSGHTWTDGEGNPLTVGQEYEMYSGKYDIPDLVRIEAIRPDSLTYTLTGEFGIEHSTEVTKEEANIERVRFHPTTQVDSGIDDGLEQNNDDHTGYEGSPERTDSSAPLGLVSKMIVESGVSEQVNPQLAWLRQGMSHTAGANYTAMEQRALIDESGVARNSDLLALDGTHYMSQADDDQFIFGW